MIEQTLRRFCEFKHRKLIVIAGTFIVGLVLVVPLVDVIRAGRDEQEDLLAELDSARNVAAELQAFEARVAEKTCPAENVRSAHRRRRVAAHPARQTRRPRQGDRLQHPQVERRRRFVAGLADRAKTRFAGRTTRNRLMPPRPELSIGMAAGKRFAQRHERELAKHGGEGRRVGNVDAHQVVGDVPLEPDAASAHAWTWSCGTSRWPAKANKLVTLFEARNASKVLRHQDLVRAAGFERRVRMDRTLSESVSRRTHETKERIERQATPNSVATRLLRSPCAPYHAACCCCTAVAAFAHAPIGRRVDDRRRIRRKAQLEKRRPRPRRNLLRTKLPLQSQTSTPARRPEGKRRSGRRSRKAAT